MKSFKSFAIKKKSTQLMNKPTVGIEDIDLFFVKEWRWLGQF